MYNYRLVHVEKEGEWIRDIIVENSVRPRGASNRTIRAKMFDA